MTAIAGLHFQALLGERPFADADRSLDRKTAAGSFGSMAGAVQCEIDAPLLTSKVMYERPAGRPVRSEQFCRTLVMLPN